MVSASEAAEWAATASGSAAAEWARSASESAGGRRRSRGRRRRSGRGRGRGRRGGRRRWWWRRRGWGGSRRRPRRRWWSRRRIARCRSRVWSDRCHRRAGRRWRDRGRGARRRSRRYRQSDGDRSHRARSRWIDDRVDEEDDRLLRSLAQVDDRDRLGAGSDGRSQPTDGREERVRIFLFTDSRTESIGHDPEIALEDSQAAAFLQLGEGRFQFGSGRRTVEELMVEPVNGRDLGGMRLPGLDVSHEFSTSSPRHRDREGLVGLIQCGPKGTGMRRLGRR